MRELMRMSMCELMHESMRESMRSRNEHLRNEHVRNQPGVDLVALIEMHRTTASAAQLGAELWPETCFRPSVRPSQSI